MKLIKLQIQGARLIKGMVLPINEKGVTEIAGLNRQGKTTVIDSLAILLEGTTKFRKTMVNNEVDKMFLKGEFSDGLTIKRNLPREGKPSISVKRIKGDVELPISSPQSLLKTLVNHIAINPMDFTRAKAVDKRKLLLEGTGIDFSEIDKKIKEKEVERKAAGQIVKAYGNPILPEKPEGEKINSIELTKEKNKIEAVNEKMKRNFERFVSFHEDMVVPMNNIVEIIGIKRNNIKDCISQLGQANANVQAADKHSDETKQSFSEYETTLVAQYEEVRRMLEDIEKFIIKNDPNSLKPISEPKYYDTKKLENKIANATTINEEFNNYEAIKNKIELKAQEQKKYDKITKDIEALRKEKAELVEKADLGIDNLRIEEDGIYINDIFSEEWSQMETLKYAIQIGVANQKLRGVAIDGYEHFDENSKAELVAWLIENDIQAIVTTVESVPENPGDNKYYIEDGEIINLPKEQTSDNVTDAKSKSVESIQEDEKKEEPEEPADYELEYDDF